MESILSLRSVLAIALACLVAGACSSSEPSAQEPAQGGEATDSDTGGGEASAPGTGTPAFGAACGGLAGFSCAGSATCIDDPRDECDPTSGGADCGGVCICESTQSCGGGMSFDASPDVCACVAGDAPEDLCASARCMRGTRCVTDGGTARCVPAPVAE